MQEALLKAKDAYAIGEVPVGAVVVKNGIIISRVHNLRETERNPLYHAEILAIDSACKIIGDWRLSDCDLYVTLEPCAMCAGAIVQARFRRLYFGAFDKSSGMIMSSGSYLDNTNLPYKTEYYGGIMEDECTYIIEKFFKETRNKAIKTNINI